MMKLFLKISFTIGFLFIGAVQATILPLNSNALTTDDYIVYNYNGIDYDIAWASPVNTEVFFIDRSYNYNLLFTADYHTGWSFAGENGIPTVNDIFSGITGSALLTQFKRDGGYVHAFEYWNSFFDSVDDNGANLADKDIASTWDWQTPDNVKIEGLGTSEKADLADDIFNSGNIFYDTFYFRASVAADPVPKPIPEPATILIFVLGIIALASKKRLFN